MQASQPVRSGRSPQQAQLLVQGSSDDNNNTNNTCNHNKNNRHNTSDNHNGRLKKLRDLELDSGFTT